MASRRARSDASRSSARRNELAASSSKAVWSAVSSFRASGRPGRPCLPGREKPRPGATPDRLRRKRTDAGGAGSSSTGLWRRASELPARRAPGGDAPTGKFAEAPGCSPRHAGVGSPAVAVSRPTSSAPRPRSQGLQGHVEALRQRSGPARVSSTSRMVSRMRLRSVSSRVQPVSLDGAGGVAGVEGHQVDLVPGGTAGVPAEHRDDPGHPARAGERDTPRAAKPARTGLVAVRPQPGAPSTSGFTTSAPVAAARPICPPVAPTGICCQARGQLAWQADHPRQRSTPPSRT